MIRSPFVLAVSTLVGAIIGAGIFGLPYAVAKGGILPALFYFVVVGGIVMILHLCLGEICLRTNEKYRLVGYAQKYLGLRGKILITCTSFVGTIGTLLIYLIIGGKFLGVLFPNILSVELLTVFFGVALALLVLQGLHLISKIELFTNITLFLAVFSIFVFSVPFLNQEHFPLVHLSDILLPYGVIFFAFIGWAAIPEVAELFKTNKEKDGFKSAIVWSSILSILVCAVFSFAVVGVSGSATTEDGLSGLTPFLGGSVVALGAFMGLVTIADSFLIFGNYLKNSLKKDYGVPSFLAFLIATGAPLILYILGVREFIAVIAVVGVLIGTVEGGTILLMFWEAKKKGDREPEFSLSLSAPALWFLGGMLVLGAVGVFVF